MPSSMRLRRIASTFCAAAALLATGAAPAAADKNPTDGLEHGVNRAKLLTKAERVVEAKRGIDVVKVSSCGPARKKRRPDYSTWICSWRAEGLWPGEVPYHCAGKARWKRKRKAWRVDACESILRYQAPLAAEPGPQPMFGYNDLWTLRAPAVFDMFAATGSDVARVNLDWRVLEFEPGRFDWRSFDRVYAQLAQRGIRPLWVLLDSPCWVQPDPGRCQAGQSGLRPTQAAYGQLADVAVAAAKRYPDSVGIEVWNEPNYPRFWGGAWPQPERYAEMLKTVADALHARAPGMPVVSAGMSPHSDSDREAIGYRNFLEELYQRGALQKADAIGVHPYPGVGPGESYVEELRIQFGAIQQLQARFGDSATPLWVTEYGVSTTGTRSFSPEQQGQALAELYTTMRRIGNIPLVIVHSFLADPGLADREGGFGVVEQDGLVPKPAYCSLRAVRGVPC